MHKGKCLCGAVSFEVSGELKVPDACHCTKCRKFTGHFLVSSDIPKSQIKISDESNITWFQSSEKVRRGFCKVCGSSLFWDPLHRDWMGIALGAFDTPTNTKIALHIFTGYKGDYYDLDDGIPQHKDIPGQS